MRTRSLPAVLLAGLLLGGCADQAAAPTDALLVDVEVRLSRESPRNFHTHATGAEEVPARDTRAQGQLKMQLSRDGQTLSYKLIVANIENVTQAHLHRAPAGANGPVVLWLYPEPSLAQPAPGVRLIPGRTQGVLAEGEITADLLVGQLAGEPLGRLIAEIMAGNIYVNVHTTRFPPGEVRGQLEAGG
jgi:hypothetical protein